MNTTTTFETSSEPAPPSRAELLGDALARTQRHGVPIRRRLLQTDKPNAEGTRAAPLAAMLGSHDSSTLDAYLLIHALASSAVPYRAAVSANSWVRMMRFDEFAFPKAAASRWSKTVRRLIDLRLVSRIRQGNSATYQLLDESGSGADYIRPRNATTDGRWSSLPYTYWLEGWDARLSSAEKILLLIAIDQPDEFAIAYDRFPAWYGISASTAQRGLSGLIKHGILSYYDERQVNARSKTGWTDVRRYSTVGDWSKPARDAAMRKRAAKHKPIVFRPANAAGEEVVPLNDTGS